MIVTTWGGAAWATAGDGFHNIGHTEQPGLLLVMVDTASATGSKQPGLCLLYTSPSPRDKRQSRMPSSA